MKWISLLITSSLILAVWTSCQGGGNAPGESNSLNPSSPSTPTVPTIPSNGTSSYALVYGSSASDRQNLSDRIAGYQAPGLSVVFSQWRRFAGSHIYNTTADLNPKTPAYCFTSFDSNYNWVNGTNSGTTIVPGTNNNCVNSDVFVGASWNYIPSPDRIYNAANGTDFNGFISALKFEKFNFQATLFSSNTDDDGIGLIIAAVVDSNGDVHTLTAMRTQGGMAPTLGWGVLYKKNNTIVSTIGAKSVGGVNTNGSAGDKLGWNSRKSLVSVQRDGNSIKAFASQWGTGSASQTVDAASEIDIDLSDANLGLGIFQGEQYYGYGTISQLGATYSDIVFSAPNSAADPTYLYDLKNNLVYYKDVAAGYSLLPGVSAYGTLGYPLHVINNETQKEFTIDSASSYTEL